MHTHTHTRRYSLLHFGCHCFNIIFRSMIYFSRSLLPSFIEKRPVRLRLEIEIKWHSKCNRLYLDFSHIPERTHTYTHIHTHAHTCTHMHIHTHIHAYLDFNHLTKRRLRQAFLLHTHIHTHTYTRTHMRTHTHTCIHTHTYAHMHTHAHIPRLQSSYGEKA